MLITTMKELSKRLLRRILRPWLIYQVFRANLSRVKDERIGMAYYFDEYPFGINIVHHYEFPDYPQLVKKTHHIDYVGFKKMSKLMEEYSCWGRNNESN